jgi:hypothetical protein
MPAHIFTFSNRDWWPLKAVKDKNFFEEYLGATIVKKCSVSTKPKAAGAVLILLRLSLVKSLPTI